MNGKLGSDEGARRIYMLREVRASLEAEPEPEIRGHCVNEVNVIGIPSGWSVIPLYGQEAHMPTETARRLKELLPADAFEPIIPAYLPPPVDDAPPSRPMLKVFDRADGDDGELEPQPAA